MSDAVNAAVDGRGSVYEAGLTGYIREYGPGQQCRGSLLWGRRNSRGDRDRQKRRRERAPLHRSPTDIYTAAPRSPYNPVNKVTLPVWSNLTVDLDEAATTNTLMLKVPNQIYTVSPLAP